MTELSKGFYRGGSGRTTTNLYAVVLAAAAEECRRQGLAHLCERLRVDFTEDVHACRLAVRLRARVPAPALRAAGLDVAVACTRDHSELAVEPEQLVEEFAAVGRDLASRLAGYLRKQGLDVEVTDAPPVVAAVVNESSAPRALPIVRLRPRDTRPGPVRQAAKIAAAVQPLEPQPRGAQQVAPVEKPRC